MLGGVGKDSEGRHRRRVQSRRIASNQAAQVGRTRYRVTDAPASESTGTLDETVQCSAIAPYGSRDNPRGSPP